MMVKRSLSILLVLAMMLSLLPLPARAQEGEAVSGSSDVTLEAENSFGSLLANTVNESQEESEQKYDARIYAK